MSTGNYIPFEKAVAVLQQLAEPTPGARRVLAAAEEIKEVALMDADPAITEAIESFFASHDGTLDGDTLSDTTLSELETSLRTVRLATRIAPVAVAKNIRNAACVNRNGSARHMSFGKISRRALAPVPTNLIKGEKTNETVAVQRFAPRCGGSRSVGSGGSSGRCGDRCG